MLLTFWEKITSIEFWLNLLNSFRLLGPLAPILMAAIESFFPPLPLVAIVLLNVAAHGIFLGFLYSWAGTCLGCIIVFLFYRHLLRDWFLRFSGKHPRVLKARKWVEKTNIPTLFMVALLPFTPSSFLNFAFGVSEFSSRKYLITVCSAKLIMISLLAAIGKSTVEAVKNPWFILISLGVLLITYVLSKKITEMKIDKQVEAIEKETENKEEIKEK